MGKHGQYRPLVIPRRAPRPFAGAMVLAALLLAAPAEAACRLALALGLDVSGSVDDQEYRAQLDGLAAALEDREVRAALFAVPGASVEVLVYEWSSAAYQRQLLPWTALENPAALAAATAVLRGTGRMPAPETTGLGAAMAHGAARLAERPGCWQRKLDISGDGRDNDWPPPRRVHDSGALAGLTLNALAIGNGQGGANWRGSDTGGLAAYFEAEVIFGEEAFVETARDFDDYAAAMRRKLLRELQVPAVGALPDARRVAAR